ncbi:PP2C family protein-serine/threonine phosphatase [Calycomorphotria hydatis]|uniref:Phosphoserine phosphatase RsbP n=1 Tax=Calycomorphotria hydatis TaxID=2528027 RepID=A0A517TCJ7_9PLAN|nr:fused response regulator/phosphatase [Calycomorphotria hydatis]QDT66090.1 Phosphoserine phosphatase RsbP [Calycomorphotria hydatis]
MRVLIGWDDAEQAELISLYLNVDRDRADVFDDVKEFKQHALSEREDYDAILMTLSSPDHDSAFRMFREIKKARPYCPIIAACKSEEVYRLAAYLSLGLRSYVLRDFSGDFVFLLKATIESTVEGSKAEAEQRAAEQMRSEIAAAHRFQDSMIPSELPQPDGYSLTARYEPSEIRVGGTSHVRLAGGDYYDAWPLMIPGKIPFTRLPCTGILLADAAGHGMRACLSITALDAIMRFTAASEHRDPGRLLSALNRSFCKQRVNQHGGSLVTAVYAVLDPRRNRLIWASAGHPFPLLLDERNGTVTQLEQTGDSSPPLGIDKTSHYQTYTAKIPKQGRVLLYTDGLSEAGPADRKHHQFGIGGVSKAMIEASTRPSEDMLASLFEAAHDFTEGAGRADDTSAVLITRQ